MSPSPRCLNHLCMKHHSLPPGLSICVAGKEAFRPGQPPPDKLENPTLLSPHSPAGQRLRRHLFDLSLMKPQHAVAPAGKVEIMGDNEGGEPGGAMKFL